MSISEVLTHDDPDPPRRRDSWRIGKEVPITVLLAIVVQTGLGIWWLATLSQKVDSTIISISELKVNAYTQSDARRDRDVMDLKIQMLQQRDSEIVRRINTLDDSINYQYHNGKHSDQVERQTTR